MGTTLSRLTPTPEQEQAIQTMLSEPTRAALNCKECSNKAIKRGLCQTHYLKEWYEQKTEPCFADRCERPAWSKGLCLKHYKRQWRHGSIDTLKKVGNGTPLTERLERIGWTVIQRDTPYAEGPCWEWNGRKLKQGYGQLDFEGQGVQAHRVAYEVWVGSIPEGLLIRHMCDNPPCINPDHLEVGTHGDNLRDMVDRNRRIYPKGEHHPAAKLKVSDVLVIRERRANGVTLKELSREFNVTESCICSIVKGHSWSHA